METNTLDFITGWGTEFILKLDAGDSPTSVADTFNVIDGFGHALSSAPEAEQSIPVQPSPRCSTSRKRKRQTPKQEIDRLRLLEYNLTRRLETLQLESHSNMRSGDNKELIFWKRIAARQYQQRVASKQENQRLKKLVASRIAHAKRLHKSVLRTIYN